MIGWFEASWWNVAILIPGALLVWCGLDQLTDHLRRRPTPQTPAGGEDPAIPRAPDSPLPGLIPPPDVTHPGKVVRLAVVYDCGTGYCGHVWRPGRGWKHQHTCTPVTPTPDQMDWWAAQLWDAHTAGEDA